MLLNQSVCVRSVPWVCAVAEDETTPIGLLCLHTSHAMSSYRGGGGGEEEEEADSVCPFYMFCMHVEAHCTAVPL
jgi:hypothetical protein